MPCTHIDHVLVTELPEAVDGCDDCLATGGQWQPPQMGYRDVNLIVPAAESAQAYEISFGDVQALESRRDTGGRRVTIPIVNGAALILLTSDPALVERLRDQVWALRPRAIAA